jgi:very-short-patch-repair endonuclease
MTSTLRLANRPHRHFSIDVPPRFCEECGKDWKAVMDGRAGRKVRKVGSVAEETLAAQLEQAHIRHTREYRFHPTRKWRADFMVHPTYPSMYDSQRAILIEVEVGAYVAGRHTRGASFEADCEKYAAAAILGYRVIRATPRQVENGTALGWIKAALGLATGKEGVA